MKKKKKRRGSLETLGRNYIPCAFHTVNELKFRCKRMKIHEITELFYVTLNKALISLLIFYTNYMHVYII